MEAATRAKRVTIWTVFMVVDCLSLLIEEQSEVDVKQGVDCTDSLQNAM